VLDYHDMPAVRAISREASKSNDKFSAFVMAIVKSPMFEMSRNNNTTTDRAQK